MTFDVGAYIRSGVEFSREGHRRRVQLNLTLVSHALAQAADGVTPDTTEVLGRLIATVEKAQGQTGEYVDHHTTESLREAVLLMRFVRMVNDVEETDNPMYNAAIWLAEALMDASAAETLTGTINSNRLFL